MENNFLQLCDIESIEDSGYANMVDIGVNGDATFILANGIMSHNSALSAVRKFRNTQEMGAFPLKGKFINVHELPNSKVIQNEEVKGLMGSIGLKLGEDPINLRYGKVYIYTDADPDGNSIAGQLINFFAKYWPELFEKGIIYKVMTPLVVAKKGKQMETFYTNSEYQIWSYKKSINVSSWEIEYKKGLASLDDREYEEILNNPAIVQITYDKEARHSLEAWFGKDSNLRKDRLLR